jgi:hypothetical protein
MGMDAVTLASLAHGVNAADFSAQQIAYRIRAGEDPDALSPQANPHTHHSGPVMGLR